MVEKRYTMKKGVIITLGIIAFVIVVEAVTLNSQNSQALTEESSTGAEQGTSSYSTSNTGEEDYEHLEYLDFKAWKEHFESDERFAFVIVQTTCGYCNQFKPVLEAVAAEAETNLYLVDILTMSKEEQSEFIASIDYFDDNPRWGTPLTLVYENQELINSLPGAQPEDLTKAFLIQNGIID